jgi:hypothetical protein
VGGVRMKSGWKGYFKNIEPLALDIKWQVNLDFKFKFEFEF